MDNPEELHVDTGELSTVNAINVSKQLLLSVRVIYCKYICYPQFMFRVSNPFVGIVRFDSNARPVAKDESYSIGTRFIIAYRAKHGAFFDYKAKNDWFITQIAQP